MGTVADKDMMDEDMIGENTMIKNENENVIVEGSESDDEHVKEIYTIRRGMTAEQVNESYDSSWYLHIDDDPDNERFIRLSELLDIVRAKANKESVGAA